MKKLLFLFIFFLISIIGKNQITQQQIDAYKGTTTNTVNAYSVTISSITATSPYDGQKIWVKFNVANTGAVTLQVNSYVARAITLNGSALVANDIVINQYVSLVYYLAGTSWQMTRPGSGAAITDWSLTGNSGTVDGTNFIGTTDNIPFNIRVNDKKAGRIDSTSRNTFFGFQSGASVTTGKDNVANGYYTLFNNTTGNKNTAIGREALYSNTTAFQSTAVGYQALYSNGIAGNS